MTDDGRMTHHHHLNESYSYGPSIVYLSILYVCGQVSLQMKPAIYKYSTVYRLIYTIFRIEAAINRICANKKL